MELIKMAQTKLTKVNKINMLLEMSEVQANLELVESNEDTIVCDMLVEELAKVGHPCTITELMTSSEVIQNYVLENGKPLTNQKITAMFKSILDIRVVKIPKGKSNLYSVKEV
jgi:hypothetical protein